MDKSIFQVMADKWPSEIIARTEVEKFTGGLISEKYQANLDSAGKGPLERIRSGRKIGYPKYPYVKWLENRSTVVSSRNPTQDNVEV